MQFLTKSTNIKGLGSIGISYCADMLRICTNWWGITQPGRPIGWSKVGESGVKSTPRRAEGLGDRPSHSLGPSGERLRLGTISWRKAASGRKGNHWEDREKIAKGLVGRQYKDLYNSIQSAIGSVHHVTN
jgi:hypothetical protein